MNPISIHDKMFSALITMFIKMSLMTTARRHSPFILDTYSW